MSFPNQLSMLRIVLAPVFLYLFLSENQLYKKLSLIVFFIAVTTDWYDGWHARRYGQVSKAGIFLDPLADKILTSIAFIGFYKLGLMPLWMVVMIVIRDITITLLRSVQEAKGKTLRTSFIAKTKTFIQMTYIFLIVILVCVLSFDIPEGLKNQISEFLYSDINFYLILSVTLLTIYTGISYFFEKEKTEEKPAESK